MPAFDSKAIYLLKELRQEVAFASRAVIHPASDLRQKVGIPELIILFTQAKISNLYLFPSKKK